MQFTINKNLVERIENITGIDYQAIDYYNDEEKVWFDIEWLEECFDDLLDIIEQERERVEELELERGNLLNQIPRVEDVKRGNYF